MDECTTCKWFQAEAAPERLRSLPGGQIGYCRFNPRSHTGALSPVIVGDYCGHHAEADTVSVSIAPDPQGVDASILTEPLAPMITSRQSKPSRKSPK